MPLVLANDLGDGIVAAFLGILRTGAQPWARSTPSPFAGNVESIDFVDASEG